MCAVCAEAVRRIVTTGAQVSYADRVDLGRVTGVTVTSWSSTG
jgi:lactam utilization protein B